MNSMNDILHLKLLTKNQYLRVLLSEYSGLADLLDNCIEADDETIDKMSEFLASMDDLRERINEIDRDIENSGPGAPLADADTECVLRELKSCQERVTGLMLTHKSMIEAKLGKIRHSRNSINGYNSGQSTPRSSFIDKKR